MLFTLFALMFLIILHTAVYCIYVVRKKLHDRLRSLATRTNTLTINLEENIDRNLVEKEMITDRVAAV